MKNLCSMFAGVTLGPEVGDLEDLGTPSGGATPLAAKKGQTHPHTHPLDLEWLRDLDVEDARRYLMSFEGLPFPYPCHDNP